MLELFKSRLFRRQFYSFTAFIAVLVVALLGVIGARTRLELVSRQAIFAELYRDQLKVSLNNWLDNELTLAKAFAGMMENRSMERIRSPETTKAISTFLSVYKEVSDIILVDGRGIIRNSVAMKPTSPEISVGDRDYFRLAMETGTSVTGFFAGRTTGRLVMTTAARYHTLEGEPMVAAVFIRLDRVSQALDALNGAGLGSAFLIDADGRLLLPASDETDKAGAVEAILESHAETLADIVPGSAAVLSSKDAGKRLFIGAYVWIPEFDAALVVHLKDDLILEPLERLQSTIIAIGAASILMALLLSFLLSARVYKPIQALVLAADKVASSNYDHNIDMDAGAELNVLIKSFNRMRQLVAERETLLVDSAKRDSLTGLYNHAAILEYLDTLASDDRPLCFAMVDIDHFKIINDTYGHQAGDMVLKVLAGILSAGVRSHDLVGRYGGEEFAVILRGRGGDETAFCERLRKAVESADFVHEGRRIPVTVSVGWSCLAGDARAERAGEVLVSAADAALYRAKAGGRNRVEKG